VLERMCDKAGQKILNQLIKVSLEVDGSTSLASFRVACNVY
jgi:hypothetical protein